MRKPELDQASRGAGGRILTLGAGAVDETDLAGGRQCALLSIPLRRAPDSNLLAASLALRGDARRSPSLMWGLPKRLMQRMSNKLSATLWMGRFFADLEQAQAVDFYRRIGTVGRIFISERIRTFIATRRALVTDTVGTGN